MNAVVPRNAGAAAVAFRRAPKNSNYPFSFHSAVYLINCLLGEKHEDAQRKGAEQSAS